jgi:hypothetical protein
MIDGMIRLVPQGLAGVESMSRAIGRITYGTHRIGRSKISTNPDTLVLSAVVSGRLK